MRATTLIAAVLLTAVTASGCGAPADGSSGSPARGSSGLPSGGDIAWKPCEDVPSQPPGAETADAGQTAWECGTLDVPLDYEKRDGEKIGIAMIRARATGTKDERIGSLLFNFGGPGGSGIETLPGFAGEYAKLRERYDLVSFDPRGVGRSEGVHCYGGKQLDEYFAADHTPDDRAEQQAFLGRIKDFARACEDRAGTVLPHVGTESAARDMDRMRAALGDEKLHYFGISYGTELGAVYAHLFPGRVGRAVLDSPVDPTLDSAERSLAQAKGFQRALQNYADDCARRQGPSCPVGDDPAAGAEDVAELLRRLDEQPIPDSGNRELTEALASGGIAQALYAKELWPVLSRGLTQAADDDGETLMVMADALNGRGPNGRYSTLQSSFTAIGCADTADRYSLADIEEKLPEFREASPVFGDFMAWGLAGCTDWPVTGDRSTPAVSAEGAGPILVVGTTGDPATPYEGVQKMVDALGDDVAVKLTRRGEGHGAYAGGGRCTRAAVDAYLLRGGAPKDGTTCRR